MLHMATVGTHVHRHVFHNAQNRHAHFFKHLDALFGIEQSDVLGGGHNHGARHGHALAERELDVTGAGRHVDDQVVQIFPIGLAQQLLKCLRGHGAAPNHGFVLVHQETNRHHLNAIVFHGFHGFAVFAFGAAFNAHHHGLAGAVDIGIEQAHTGAFCGQRQRQIDSGGALAYAALARGNGHDVFHLRQQCHAALSCMGHNFGSDIGRHVGDAWHLLGSCNQCVAQARNLALGGIA